MSTPTSSDILPDTIRYLEQQKRRGVRFLRIGADVLRDWQVNGAKTASQGVADGAVGKIPMDAARRMAFEELKKEALACRKCPHLVRFRKQVVFGVGNPDAELMFIGEAPGADEDRQGEPFVGRAGQLLTRMIQAMGLERSDVYIGNILKCRPDVDTPSGNRKPTPEEMATCIPYLRKQIHFIRPLALVALGDTAVKGLVPSLKDGISRLRGKWLEFEGIPLMPTFHPAYLLRNPNPAIKRQCWEDLLAVMEKLGKPISEKQKRYFLSAVSERGARTRP